MLPDLLADHGGDLRPSARAAFRDRLEHIAAKSAAAQFQHARRRRRYGDVAWLLAADPNLRQRIWRRVRRGCAVLMGATRPVRSPGAGGIVKPS